jgi:hypothetical protein
MPRNGNEGSIVAADSARETIVTAQNKYACFSKKPYIREHL